MSQACSKFCRPIEIEQMKATMDPDEEDNIVIVSAGGYYYALKDQREEIQKTIAQNIKAQLIKEKESRIINLPKPRVIIADAVEYTVENQDKLSYARKDNTSTKYQSNKDITYFDKVDSGNRGQGKIGEIQADFIAREVLGLTPVAFDMKENGFDLLYRDKDNNLVVVEAKFTKKPDGIRSLEKTENVNREPSKILQMSDPWIQNCISGMKGEPGFNQKLFTKLNSELANEIEKQRKSGELRKVIIHTHTETMNVIISETDKNGEFENTGVCLPKNESVKDNLRRNVYVI